MITIKLFTMHSFGDVTKAQSMIFILTGHNSNNGILL